MKYLEEAKELWKKYVPKRGQAGTVQGELLRSIEKLRNEAQRNGNVNWDDGHERLSDFVLSKLKDVSVFSTEAINEIERDISRIKNYSDPYTDDDLYDRLTDYVIEWYKAHPEPIPHQHDPDLLR